jgi:hypothetical protein
VSGAAFYCVADERYFIGAVGLVNSLRLLGHEEPILLLDCGLTAAQRDLLEPHVRLLPAPGDTPPWLLKTVAPLAEPADVMILLDTDMVATRSLAPLAERAREGGLVAFADPLDRWVPEWGELLGLGEARRGDYVSTGALLAGGARGREILRLLAEHQAIVEFERTYWRENEPGYAFAYADQDVLNAILATRGGDGVVVLEERLAATPPFEGLRIRDERGLACEYEDGAEPYLVHHHVVRPWLEQTEHGVYSRLLRRLLVGGDVAIRVPEADVAPWLRSGPRAWAMRARHDLRERMRRRSAGRA